MPSRYPSAGLARWEAFCDLLYRTSRNDCAGLYVAHDSTLRAHNGSGADRYASSNEAVRRFQPTMIGFPFAESYAADPPNPDNLFLREASPPSRTRLNTALMGGRVRRSQRRSHEPSEISAARRQARVKAVRVQLAWLDVGKTAAPAT